jgi:hypothetical protein
VSRLQATDGQGWELKTISDHPNGNWPAALAVARDWVKSDREEIERGQLRVKVDPLVVRRLPVPRWVVSSGQEVTVGR